MLLKVDHIKNLRYYFVYIVLFSLVLFVNKFVLTVLKFTYPTIFQSWQMLVGVLILRPLIEYFGEQSWPPLKITFRSLNRDVLLSVLPFVVAYVFLIVSGSKLLAVIPIPMYLALTNIIPCLQWIYEHVYNQYFNLSSESPGSEHDYFPLLTTLLPALLLAILIEIYDLHEQNITCISFWTVIHVISGVFIHFYANLCDKFVNTTDLLYLGYVFSVIILAPASLFLNEAFLILDFKHKRKFSFYIGCFLSGILGVCLNLWSLKLWNRNLKRDDSQIGTHEALVRSVAKIIASLISVLVFTNGRKYGYLEMILISLSLSGNVLMALCRPPFMENVFEKRLLIEV